MKPEEKVFEFCENFDASIREYENCEPAVPLAEQEKRLAFYQVVTSVMPKVRAADFIRRQTTAKEMNLDELKSFLTQSEAEMEGEEERKVKTREETLVQRG